jgi:hypothetical protein
MYLIKHWVTLICVLGLSQSLFDVLGANAQTHSHIGDDFPQISQSADSKMPFDPLDTLHGPTQTDLNSSPYPRTLNSVMEVLYSDLIEDHQSIGDTTFIKEFALAQTAWLKYREAELRAILPPPDTREARGALFSHLVGENIMWR